MSEKKKRENPRVTVALDGSPAAATALPTARAVARQLGVGLEVLHVSPRRVPESTLRRRLGVHEAGFEKTVVSACRGEPVACILRHTKEPDVELVVLTTHGRSIEPGRALGRTAAAVISACTRPVLLVRPVAAARRGAPIRRLLFPLDGSPSTANALKDVTSLAYRLGASVDLLYVIAGRRAKRPERGSMRAPRYLDQSHHEWAQWASEMTERLCVSLAECPAEVPIRVFIRQGEAGAEIIRFAKQHRHDVVVLVRRSHLEAGRAQTLRAVLQYTPCPILLVGCQVRRRSPRASGRPPTISRRNYDAVILDMDGVVTRTANIHAQAWKRLFDEYLARRAACGGGRFRPFDANEDYRRYVDGKPRYDGVASFLAARGITLPYGTPDDSPRRETVCGLGNKKDRYFMALLQKRPVEVYQSTVALLQRLKALGLKAGIFSASKHAEAVLRRTRVLDLFEARVDGAVAEELGLPGKPDPAMLLETTSRLGAAPRRTVVIEDAIAGVQAGRAGHFGLVIGVNRGRKRGELARSGATVEVEDLAQVIVQNEGRA